MEADAAIGREQDIQSAGKFWRLGRWDRQVWEEFRTWAKTKIPNPLDAAEEAIGRLLARKSEALAKGGPETERLAAFYEQQADKALQMALAKKDLHLSVSSPEVLSLLNSVEGSTKVMHLLLKTHQPDVTEDEAYWVVMGLGGNAKQVFATAAGKPPPAAGNG